MSAALRLALAPRTAAAALAVAAAAGVGGGAVLHLALGPSRGAGLALPELHGQAVWPPHARPAPALAGRRGRTALVAVLGRRCGALCAQERRAIAQAVAQLPAGQRPLVVARAGKRLAAALGMRPSADAIVLVDRRGDARTAYAVPFLPGFVAHDLAALAEES